ncbi:MAG: DUF5017 domain-containing protein [Mangrovibacterium sp.]
MERLIIIMIMFLFTGIFWSSCEDRIEMPEFDVWTDSDTYAVGEEITFHFSGDPQNIAFWSGELGHIYANRDRTSEQGAIQTVQFTSLAGEGAQNDNLSFLVSTDFNGTYDAANLAKATWTDITDRAVLPATLSDIDITFARSNQLTITDHGDYYDLRTTGTDPYIQFSPVGMSLGSSPNSTLEFEYKSQVDITDLQIFFAPPISEANSFKPANLAVASDWTSHSISLAPAISAGWGADPADYLRFDWGKTSGKNFQIRNIKIHIPAGSSTSSGAIDISDFGGTDDPVYFAFRYVSESDDREPRTWAINAFSVINHLADGVVNTVVESLANAGFKGINVQDETCQWTFAPDDLNPTSMTFVPGEAGSPANEDWAVSLPVNINKVSLVDYGESVISISTLTTTTSFTYTYEAAGVYRVAFYAFNEDVDHLKGLVKELTITITP